MSNLHATADARDHQTAAFSTAAVEVAATVGARIQGFAMHITAAIEQRFTQRRLTRLSKHMLRDLGFERDWEGAIHPLRDAD